jgi:Tfp pilus assembly protein PilV
MQRRRERVSLKGSHDAGFTVVEFVAAAVILFVVLMGVLGAVQYAGAANQMSSMRQGAIDVATEQIEFDRNIPYSSLGVYYSNGYVGNPSGTIPATTTVTTDRGTYAVATTITWQVLSNNAAYKELSVKVSWMAPTSGSMSVETAVYGNGSTTNLANVELKAVDSDNPAQAVAGAMITLGPSSGTNMVGVSQSDGTVFFANVPTGKCSFPVTYDPNYLIDTSGLGTPTLAVGFQNLGFFYVQKPCTATFHVHSTSVTNYPNATVTLKDLDHSLTFTGKTDSNGNVTFSKAAGTTGQYAGLWKSGSSGYQVYATAGAATSPTQTFKLTVGGQNFSGIDLALPDPPSITISKKVSSTGAALNGVNWNCTVKDPSGTTIGTFSTNGSGGPDSYTVMVTTAGNYTVGVTGVTGFLDTPSYTFSATTSGVNQPCVVPMQPLFLVNVFCGSTPCKSAQVTMTNATSGAAVNSTAGVSPGITDANGNVGYIIPATANYNLSAVVNGVTYSGGQTSLNAASPPLTPYPISITPGHLLVGVSPGTGSWSRPVAIYDSSSALVATATVTVAAPSVNFTLPGGMYTITLGGTLSPSWSSWPTTLPSNTASKYKNYALTSPGVPTNGGTYTDPTGYPSVTGLSAAN